MQWDVGKKLIITSCFAMQNGLLTETKLTALNSLLDRLVMRAEHTEFRPAPATTGAAPDRPHLARRIALQDDDFVRTGEIERRPRLLVEHVAVEMLGTQQRDAPIERLALAVELRQLGLGELHVLGQALPGKQPALALHEM